LYKSHRGQYPTLLHSRGSDWGDAAWVGSVGGRFAAVFHALGT